VKEEPLGLTEALHYYLSDCEARGEAGRTVEGKRSNLGAFIRWCHQHHIERCQDLDQATLEWYRSYVSQYVDPHRHRKLDIATQRNRLTAIRVFLKRLQYLRLIACNPADFFELPSVPHRIPRAVLSEAEIELILKHVLLYGEKGIRDRAILETFYATGIRRMELGRLVMTDVDTGSQVIRIQGGKGGKDRRVPIARRACSWIERYLREVRPKYVHPHSGPTLFLSSHGRPLRPGQLSRLGGKYIHRAGVNKPGACHLWRHSAATLMLENGAGLRQIQEMLGHASITTTQLYTHVTIKQLKEVYSKCHPAAREARSE
jgi:integrase/recombinase XerD